MEDIWAQRQITYFAFRWILFYRKRFCKYGKIDCSQYVLRKEEKAIRVFANMNILEKFMAFPDDRRDYLLHLRELIFYAAEGDARIGRLSEELRWGDPSYITAMTKAGSTVRLGLSGRSKVSLLFHCKTTLVESFKTLYSDTLEYSKNRAILIDPKSPPKDEILHNCVSASLLYKIDCLTTK